VDETCEIDPDWTPGVATYAVILSTILALFTIVNFIHGWRRDSGRKCTTYPDRTGEWYSFQGGELLNKMER
ncbi:MAG: hypothetical protein LBD56_02000, partial [Endomicrobium sp.]|nr:hypothetical protein [Endomicrobium sp.]